MSNSFAELEGVGSFGEGRGCGRSDSIAGAGSCDVEGTSKATGDALVAECSAAAAGCVDESAFSGGKTKSFRSEAGGRKRKPDGPMRGRYPSAGAEKTIAPMMSAEAVQPVLIRSAKFICIGAGRICCLRLVRLNRQKLPLLEM